MKVRPVWFVYMMAAPAGKGLTYFKVGRTSDVAKRIGGVQTGCPLRITKVWALTLYDCGESQRIEKLMQGWLGEFHTHGEWFKMETDSLTHKQAMAKAMKDASEHASQFGTIVWKAMDVGEIRKALAEIRVKERQEKDARTTRTNQKNFRIAVMARYKRHALCY